MVSRNRMCLPGSPAGGVPNTPMPAFGTTLSRQDLNAVIAFVGSLNGVTGSGGDTTSPITKPINLSPEATIGRDVFCDALRGFSRCSTCHKVNGIGILVAPPISHLPRDVPELRNLAAPSVRTAMLGNKAMPSLSVSNGSHAAIFYDLTTAPPVQRTVAPGTVTWGDASTWRNFSVIGKYDDRELASVLVYLRTIIQQ
jgi:mono/diheme cytochrome c family protein